MPTFEGYCENCNGTSYEYLLRRWDEPDPNCPECGKQVKRGLSAPAVVWAKGIGQYCGENSEGHWATSRDPETSEVQRHFITSRKQQKDFCKRYGYYDPAEIPTEVTAGDDGKKTSTTGSKGGWI